MTSPLIGKTILVDIKEFDSMRRLRTSRNYFGTIVGVDEGGIDVRRDDTNGIDRIDVSVEDLEDAPAGDYWLRSTGQAVPKPDFIAAWTHAD